jgi:micrococcal nuclease
MKKIFNWKNIGWMLAVILWLILVLKEGSNNKIIETRVEEIIPTITITPTEIEVKDLFLVSKIIDGDTLMVKINDKEEAVRLIGVDTPETVDPRKTVQCFGKEATEKAKELVENKMIRLEIDTTQNDRDKYNRLLRYIYLEDGTLVNKKLIEEGFGFEYTYQIPYKFQLEFKAAQKLAEEKKLGMWADGACPTVIPTKILTTIKQIPTEKQIQTVKSEIITINNSDFVCNCNKSCTQISSCEEAYFQLNNCGCSVRDNDGDGVPCESLCR